ncbi:hypothetical protein CLOSYM_03073 [[Clostridium] symbiosum ATCC 14940]|uniref:Uncharacterized protein n=1 Tax=[Clostridium] symbiosum ATCC 14940 TaxID=411472 RepID=A0ABC9TVV7_CLOSY|nr:hypothetical protein CLOSYM_03073 [[Clostridium] symbiosum ATCC 14940]
MKRPTILRFFDLHLYFPPYIQPFFLKLLCFQNPVYTLNNIYICITI